MSKKLLNAILITAAICLVFLVVSSYLISPAQGSTLETIMFLPTIPVVIGIVVLFRARNNITLPPYLRAIGWIIFVVWILSFFIDNGFRG